MMLGHENISTTGIYTNVSTEKIKDNYDLYYPEGQERKIMILKPAKNYIVLLKVDAKYVKIETADMNLSMKAGVECGIVKN